MSALLSGEIIELLDSSEPDDRLIISPLLDRESQVSAGTVDVRLGTEFLEVSRQESAIIDPFGDDGDDLSTSRSRMARETKHYVPLGEQFVLHPGQFVLGCTLEFIGLPVSVVGQVLSRSSWGRLGLLVATAVVVQPGFKGVLTLELVNAGSVPIVLRPGLRIAQIQLWRANSSSQTPYSSDDKYVAPLGPESNKLAWERGERTRLKSIADSMHGRASQGPV